jgi:putative ABC transport system permease protein
MMQAVWARLRALFRRNVISDEISEELGFHLDMRVEELEQCGVPSIEARRSVLRRFGNVAVHRDRGYDIRGGGFLETVLKDVRFALHLLRRRPSYSISAILTLALGIGLTTTLLSIIDAAWLRPLPFPAPGQLVQVKFVTDNPAPNEQTVFPSLADVRALREANQVLEGIGQWHRWEERLVLDDNEPERIKVLTMSEGYADLYGVPTVLGRTFRIEDDRPGAPAVALLGHAYWRRRFNADPNIIGKTLLVGNISRTVVGVLPPLVHRNAQMWIPDTRPEVERHRNSGAETYARVKSGISLRQAEEILGGHATSLPVPGRHERITGVKLEPLYDEAVASTSDAMSMIVASALVLVALVCVNVAGLIFADGADRRREFAVRTSMGAGRGRLIRQHLTDSPKLVCWASSHPSSEC